MKPRIQPSLLKFLCLKQVFSDRQVSLVDFCVIYGEVYAV